jgi:hypothetical protein
MIRAIAPPPPDGTRWLPRKTSPGTGRLVGSPALSSPPNDRSRGHADLTYRCASARARRRAARARDRLRDLRRTGASARQRDPRDPRHHQQPSRHRPAHRRPPPWPVERPHRVGKALRHPPLQRGVVERARLLASATPTSGSPPATAPPPPSDSAASASTSPPTRSTAPGPLRHPPKSATRGRRRRAPSFRTRGVAQPSSCAKPISTPSGPRM